jgi:hypothetical protein
MDSVTGFDEDEYFFGSYDAEQASVGASPASHELGEAEAQPPSPEQLTHLARFRRPVAGVVAAMALLSIVGLVRYGSLQHAAQRELVAHYGSASAAPTLSATASGSVEQSAAVSDASSALVSETWSTFVAEAVSAFVPEASAANAAAPTLAVSVTGPALEPAARPTALTDIWTQPDYGPISSFVSALTSMCLRPAQSDVTLGVRATPVVLGCRSPRAEVSPYPQ